MNKMELKKNLETGKTLCDLLEFTDGQECLIYKRDFSTDDKQPPHTRDFSRELGGIS